MSAGIDRSQRSPPGVWRLFAPALLAWGAAALAVAQPDLRVGAWLALTAATIGGAGVALSCLGGSPGALGRGVLASAGVACAVLLLIGARVTAEERVRADPGLSAAAADDRVVELEAMLDGYPESSRGPFGDRTSVRATVDGRAGRVPVLLWLDDASAARSATWGPGTSARVSGTPVALALPASTAFGVRVERLVELRTTGLGAGFARGAAGLRSGLSSAAANVPGAALVPGMSVGDTSLVDDELEALMRDSSLLHLLAVSGANCALVTDALISGAAVCGIGRRGRLVLGAGGLAGFVAVVGPDASVRRAAVMACVMLVSRFGGKRAVALPSLGVAILVLLLQDPWQAVQAGFALSVAATAGILLLVPALSEGIHRLVRAPSWLVLPIAVALAAQLSCGPFLLLLQPGIPAVGIAANAIAGPIAPLGTGLGLLAMLVLPAWEGGGTLLVTAASLPARWVEATARVTAELPLAHWSWPQGWIGAVLLAGAELSFLGARLLLAGRLGSSSDPTSEAGRDRPGPAPWRARRPRPERVRVAVAVLLCGGIGAFVGPTLVAPAVTRAGTPDDWIVAACDVGQGDAILLRDPREPARTMLVDTGDDPERLGACLERFGVGRLALLVLTHDDRDHVGALDAVIDRVDEAIVAPDSLEDAGPRTVVARLERARVPVTRASSGMTGALSRPGLAWRVLAPDAGAVPADTNAASVVLRVTAGGAVVLLLADTGAEEHRALMRNRASLLRADVLKVAHHGSRDSDAELVRSVGAAFGLVSVGADNGYGHPAADALAALERAGTVPLRTDRLGSIALSPASGSGSGHGPDGFRVWVEHRQGRNVPSAASAPTAMRAMSVLVDRLDPWRRQARAQRARARRRRSPSSIGARRGRHRWCSSAAPRRSSRTGPPMRSASLSRSSMPSSRSTTSTPPSTPRGSCSRSRAPPCSPSRGSSA